MCGRLSPAFRARVARVSRGCRAAVADETPPEVGGGRERYGSGTGREGRSIEGQNRQTAALSLAVYRL